MKLQMKVVLVGDKTLRITLVHVCDEAMKCPNTTDNKLYQDPYNDIIIWSFGNFGFDERHIRLPERNRLLSSLTHVHKFKSEEERYTTLKKYYYTLTNWSLSTKMFPNTDTLIKDRVRMRNTYWIVI